VEILGVAQGRFDPALLRATANLTAAVDAAVEAYATQVEPAHLLIALGRIAGGLTEELFARKQLPVNVFCHALRPAGAEPPGWRATGLTEKLASPATRAVFAALDGRNPIGERDLLAVTLRNLDPQTVRLLRDYARVELADWITEADSAEVAPLSVFDESGRLITARFSPGAQVVLATMASEAGALNRTTVGTVLLLHAMATVPNGVIEQACHFLQHDVRGIRVQLYALTGGRVGTAIARVRLDTATIEAPLRLVLDKAAATAAARHGTHTSERDLLVALLDIPGGLAASFFHDVGMDVARLRRYAVEYYQEPPYATSPLETHAQPLRAALAELHERVVGQPMVIEQLQPHVELIKRSMRRGYRMDDRPHGTFLFCGPSGTGKTMTARILAKVIYGSEDDLVMFEMGQFNGWESINNFIGAPPAYIGFGQGKLTNALRDNPRRVLLFDEVEKADQRVFDALLRLLDEGRISDPAGPVRDARDSVIVLTSNLATGDLRRDETSVAEALRSRFEEFFRAEFLNRIDEVVLFSPFGPAELRAIAVLGLRKQAALAASELEVTLTWSAEVPEHIARTAARLRRHEAARGVNRCVGGLVSLLLRLLDTAEDENHLVRHAKVVVREGSLAVEECPDG
jgi:ATP-dependent Clp protease ATP-binding subunit ClpA